MIVKKRVSPIIGAGLFGGTAMPKRVDLHLIPGGRSEGSDEPAGSPISNCCDQLLQKAQRYRDLAVRRSDTDLEGLVGDMTDAIKALALLEQSTTEVEGRRAIEYRRLIAELEIEIVSALER